MVDCNHDLMPVGRETAVCRTCGRIRWQDIAHFRKHLENASAIVATWPLWKQNILDISQSPTVKTPRKPVNNGNYDCF